MRSFKDSILLFLKGMAMGGADVIPGVSGGTIAFISGIYEELLRSINSIDLAAIKLLFSGEIKTFWAKINGNFLLTLFSGILISLFSLARVISFFMVNHPFAFWSFFFGLILISAILVLRKIHSWAPGIIIAGIIGVILAYFLTTFSPAETNNGLFYVFLSGMVAICAMILPGISGSFILLILGKYEFIINAVKELKIDVIIVFALGCVIGLLSFSRLVSWVLQKYHNITISLLAGFMLGSLNKIWPWKQVLEFRIDRHGDQVPLYDKSIMPNKYFELTGNDPHFLEALLFALLGIIVILGVERIATMMASRS